MSDSIRDTITVSIYDTGQKNIVIMADSQEAGTQFENYAKQFLFMRPERYQNDNLILYFKDSRKTFAPERLGKESVFPIGDTLTQEENLNMQIAFERNGVIVVRSDILQFSLRQSLAAGTFTAAKGIPEAPFDSKQYARQNGAWEEIAGGGSAGLLGFYISDDGDLIQTYTDGTTPLDLYLNEEGDLIWRS
ncbi:MAG: hypothetical protein LBV27_09050 [Oscillospiraceae bacterium]|jgi:predicted PhzF superfamily epimerase YddE/YHI9|nr:hypothetical protein [Oscillospiraceae bacterium]